MSPRTVRGNPAHWVVLHESTDDARWTRTTWGMEAAAGVVMLVEQVSTDQSRQRGTTVSTSVVYVPDAVIRDVGGYDTIVTAPRA